MLKQLFNYYVVLKSCWIILLFLAIGFFGLVVMEQGKDILQSLSFTAQNNLLWHTWFALFAVFWWGWQSWRSGRVILHYTTFDFIKFNKRYALQAQVIIPRVLGVLPALIFAAGLLTVSGWSNPLVYVYLCLAIWLYIFFHIRKDIIVLFMSRNKIKFLNIPDYIPVKNEAYPAKFIWQKQRRWIWFRLYLVLATFTLVVLYPVSFPQLLGSAAIILFSLGAWLVIAVVLDYAEKRFRFPFTFSIVLMTIVFSFFNNNHKIRVLDGSQNQRVELDEHFDEWYAKRAKEDTIPLVMIASQGGGVRAAYWTAQVLADIQEDVPQFEEHIYSYSGVSGGSLGIGTFKQLIAAQSTNLKQDVHQILSQDFLSPISAWLVVPDLIQKFLPFPIYSVDRAKALEYSWEQAANIDSTDFFNTGFLEAFADDESVIIFNATKVENGFRTLVTNVKPPENLYSLTEDFFDATQTDVRLSTAISVSSRFPFISPPAVVFNAQGKKWGHLVDGGYVENMGATPMLLMYDYLSSRAAQKGYKIKFHLMFIKNTKEEYNTKIKGMYEVLGPINTLSKVWVNSGYFDESSPQLRNLLNSDQAFFVSLDRPDEKIIPLGWYLSPTATAVMNEQVPIKTAEFKSSFKAN